MPVIKSVINVIYCIGFSNLYIELTLLISKWSLKPVNHPSEFVASAACFAKTRWFGIRRLWQTRSGVSSFPTVLICHPTFIGV